MQTSHIHSKHWGFKEGHLRQMFGNIAKTIASAVRDILSESDRGAAVSRAVEQVLYGCN